MDKTMLTYTQYRSKVIASDPDYQYSEVEIQGMYSYYTSSFHSSHNFESWTKENFIEEPDK